MQQMLIKENQNMSFQKLILSASILRIFTFSRINFQKYNKKCKLTASLHSSIILRRLMYIHGNLTKISSILIKENQNIALSNPTLLLAIILSFFFTNKFSTKICNQTTSLGLSYNSLSSGIIIKRDLYLF